jgi:hypothetical protein
LFSFLAIFFTFYNFFLLFLARVVPAARLGRAAVGRVPVGTRGRVGLGQEGLNP